MAMFNTTQYQSIQGPADPFVKSTELEGYQPVSRIGEIVINAFVDGHEFVALKDGISAGEISGIVTEATPAPDAGNAALYGKTNSELKPHFHEWATATPGMICVARKARHAIFRAYVAAETATPVIACAAMQPKYNEKQFYFAGICRSKSVRPIDDGMGPTVDEYFTLAIGGQNTILNNSKENIFPGDMIAWTFFNEAMDDTDRASHKRSKTEPRRIGVEISSPSNSRIIGRALSFAKPGETFDLLIKGA